MSKKESEALPSVDSVLNKLKGDGTFDQFRRTCLGHIQGEPSFRSYSEHIEVVSRRYLQNYKWKESSTKNDVRGRLRDHALGVIVSPDIQVGTPLIDIVEKVLESKARELLPKITEAVDHLCEARAKQLREAQLKKEAEPFPVQAELSTTEAPKSDFDLSIPFDLPGLNTSKKESQPKKETSGTGKKDGEAKVRTKTKSADSLKDTKAGNKSKPGPLKTTTPGKDGAKSKSEQKPVVDKEKEKPRFRIPKKPRVEKDSADKQEKENHQELSSDIETKETKITGESAVKDTGGPKAVVGKRRSARIASQSDSKASSDNDAEISDEELEVSAPPVKKRRRSSSQPDKRRSKAMIHSSSDESEISEYETDTSEESIHEVDQHRKRRRSVEVTLTREKSKRKSKPSHKLRASRSPPVVVTRYNRSVKPNRKYTDAAEMEDDDSQTTLEDTEDPEQSQEEDMVTPMTLDITRPCDTGEMEIQGEAVSTEGGVVYEMIRPKPPPMKVRKTLMKGLRSRKKTNTRISFFCHR